MGINEIIINDVGRKMFLLGNEAIVRGFLEGGGGFASTYPGTPSSEIGNVLFRVAKDAGVYFEFSTNEKVALESAAAAAASGVRSMVFMKLAGLNVAADSFMSTVFSGTNAGFIVLTADDPSMHSSGNEQDNRTYARFARMPLLEPRNPDEARRMVKYGFEISEKYKIPVMIRTTTRTSHVRGIVEFGKKLPAKVKGRFEKDSSRFIMIPANSRALEKKLFEKLPLIRSESEISPFNYILGEGRSEVGIVTSGAASNYTIDIVNKYSLPIDILTLGFTYPVPEELMLDFLKKHNKVIVVEELEPFIENDLRVIKEKNGITAEIIGKDGKIFTPLYEYTPDRVKEVLFSVLGVKKDHFSSNEEFPELPSRPPVLCPGCPHRATYYSINKVLMKHKIREVTIFPSDIGCYGLGIQPPFKTNDWILSMGSGIGAANGFSKVTDQPIVSFIGDSTFFHAGIPALINAYHNRDRLIFVILDNSITAMTGHQPNSGNNINGMGEKASPVKIEEIVKGIGIQFVKVIDPYNLKETQQVFEEALNYDGLAVIVARRECALIRDARVRKAGKWTTYTINQDKCTKCKICITQFACPAIFIDQKGNVKIDETLCDGCGVCAKICPFNAIEVKL